MNTTRRALIGRAAGLGAAAALPGALLAQTSTPTKAARRFDPEPGDWRTFEVTTRIDLPATTSATRVWVPLPSVQTPWQQTLGHTFSSNGQARLASDGAQGVRMVAAEFAPGAAQPFVEVTSRVRTQSRDESQARRRAAEDSATLREALKPTRLLPTDGIVRDTARDIVRDARTDEDKARAIYAWIVDNTFRDPKVRGCGNGDIRTMIETGNLSGKCADLNALYVGLARAVGLPARDVYGIRVADSRFGYKSLGKSGNISKAQHCRAEVFLERFGWVPVDPADVRKVVLEEPPGNLSMIDPKVIAARKQLFGAWEMNWLAYNDAHDLKLANSSGREIPFLMYPQGETNGERFDSLDPDAFRYTLTSTEIA